MPTLCHPDPVPEAGVAPPPLTGRALVFFAAAARLLPRGANGRPVHVATLGRWRDRGLRGIHLPAARVGGRWATTAEDLRDFLARAAAAGPAQPPRRPPSAARRRRVGAELDREGL